MKGVPGLVAEVAVARVRLVQGVEGLSTEGGVFRPAPDGSSVREVIEHLVLAEQAGINRIWQAAEGVRLGRPVWTGDPAAYP